MNPLHSTIACSILQPALRSLLIFDAPFSGLEQISQQILFLASESGQKLRLAVLSSQNEDDLWGESILPDSLGTLNMHPQLFTPPSDLQENLLILIPDLSTLSLAAARASIMLVGTNIAHLERQGQQAVWSPRYYWLAGCPQYALGSVSPHLLDRFALRLSWQASNQIILPHQERLTLLQSTVQQISVEPFSQPDPDLLASLKKTIQAPPLISIPDEASERILAYFTDLEAGTQEVIHQRRELALARCAVALAQLEGEDVLSKNVIDEAAQLMGLHITKQDTSQSPEHQKPAPFLKSEEKPTAPSPTSQPQPTSSPKPEVSNTSIEAQISEADLLKTIEYVTSALDPYPEDTQPILREAASLQLPHQQFVGTRSDRGPIIGIEPATTLRDLALVSTLTRALLFQAFRPKQAGIPIVLDWSDLRKYRRAAAPERLLLILLDYTCLSLAQRQQALVPYLSQAYIERSSITIVKVGAAREGSTSHLSAESVTARNILASIISDTIDAPAGNATPLAHGLELALRIIQRTLQHGRSTVQQITFVVLSDGRGNIPLKASHSHSLSRPVALEGVTDALELAQEIGEIKHVSSVILSPRLRYYKHLPQQLADALKAPLLLLEDKETIQV